MSAPEILSPQTSNDHTKKLVGTIGGGEMSNIPPGSRQVDYGADESLDHLSEGEPPPLSVAGDSFRDEASFRSDSVDEHVLQEELDAKWILNLSMHFRDMSDREKFFITYAEEPNKWRRVTVSCDYRQIQHDSLEADLKGLHYQRDKSARIYEAIRDSLPAIQFYDTVTNLKLQTADGRLHVHVTEDVNEIIPYPSISALDHLQFKKSKESSVSFDSHISGFVYKVNVNGKAYIKKEIPGPDAVEEFLYEINALRSLEDSKSVIKFEGIIMDETSQLIKGLLISYAEQGALVDLIYDYKMTDRLPWDRRERWARQIVEGLSEIHEAGFVQGDFTLSNIVIDQNDDAKIIDINRRGCPVGWEPPELARLIESGQRISIYIGVKSDLFQLGMVLWALAEQNDEPERQERPLIRNFGRYNTIPDWYRDIVQGCLEENPRLRPAAKDILANFPEASATPSKPMDALRSISNSHAGDPLADSSTSIGLDDMTRAARPRSRSPVRMPSTEYLNSSSSYILPSRGRSPGHRRNSPRRSDYSPYESAPRSIMSLDDSEMENELASLPASRETRWEQVYVDGDTRLVQRGSLAIEAHDFANQDPPEVCITTPPSELETPFAESGGKGDDTPLQLSTIAELQPPPQVSPTTTTIPEITGQRLSHNASFSDRVHHLSQVDEAEAANTLAELENEVALDASVTESSISRTGTGFSTIGTGRFSPPMHQDSGFAEPVSYEAERIRQSLDEKRSLLDEDFDNRLSVRGRLWDEQEGTLITEEVDVEEQSVEGTVAQALEHGPVQSPIQPPITTYIPSQITSVSEEKALEEKVSNTTIRPPSIVIPEFHHAVPTAMDSSPVSTLSHVQTAEYSPVQTWKQEQFDIPESDSADFDTTPSESDNQPHEKTTYIQSLGNTHDLNTDLNLDVHQDAPVANDAIGHLNTVYENMNEEKREGVAGML
jgi:serine/threonine protein kinase